MKKIKVFFFIPSLQGGGAERVSYRIASHLNPELFDVTLLVGKKEGQYVSLLPANLAVYDLKKKHARSCIIPLSFLFKKEKPDVIISFMHHSNIAVLLAKAISMSRVKVITSERNVMEGAYKSRVSFFLLPLVRLLYRLSDASLSNSVGLKNNVRDFLKIPERKFRVIYNPVDFERIYFDALKNPDHPWLEKKEGPVILGVGRLEPQKDFATLIRAFAKVRKPKNSRLLILGEGRLKKDLLALAKEIGVESRVDFPGFKLNPYSFFKKADLFILSSLWEGFPSVLVESLALAVPVVSTNCNYGPSEIVEHGVSGLLVSPGNVNEMALAIERMLTDPKFAAICGENGKNSVKRLAIDKIAKQYEEFITAVVK